MTLLKNHCKLSMVILNGVRIEKWLVVASVENNFNLERSLVSHKNTERSLVSHKKLIKRKVSVNIFLKYHIREAERYYPKYRDKKNFKENTVHLSKTFTTCCYCFYSFLFFSFYYFPMQITVEDDITVDSVFM